jgi:hypothetical protein
VAGVSWRHCRAPYRFTLNMLVQTETTSVYGTKTVLDFALFKVFVKIAVHPLISTL